MARVWKSVAVCGCAASNNWEFNRCFCCCFKEMCWKRWGAELRIPKLVTSTTSQANQHQQIGRRIIFLPFWRVDCYWCNLSQIDAERPCLLILSSDWLLHQRDSICCEAWIQMQEDLIVWFTLHWHTCVFVICVFLAVPNQGTQRLHDHFYVTLNGCTRVFTTRFIHLVWHSLQ